MKLTFEGFICLLYEFHVKNNNFFSVAAIHESHCCMSIIGDGLSRMLPSPFGGTKRSNDVSRSYSNTVTRINSPGQRFTATHGISAEVGYFYIL